MTDNSKKDPSRAAITSPDMNAERLQELKRLFPDLFNGEGQLDEDALRAVVSPQEGSGIERFCFEWPGKHESKRRAFTPSRATLVADEKRSVNFKDTQNVIIEGDNLEALKLLQTTYFEKVKCIYIDPPYNTGNDFIYPDNFAEGKKAYWQKNGTIKDGVKLISNPETSGRRHSNWLNMMQPRLLLARQLLREDGVIFISIDDNEVHHLRKLCDEVFGEDNFISQFVIQTNPRGRSLDKFVAKTFEYVICYAKNINKDSVYQVKKGEKAVSEYNKDDNEGQYRLLELRNRNPSFNKQNRPNLYYPIYINPNNGRVSLSRDNLFCEEALPLNSNNEEGCWTWGKEKVGNENEILYGKKANTGFWRVYRKDYIPEGGAFTKEKSLWLDKNINHENGKEELAKLFNKTGNKVPFDFPKSVFLPKKCLNIGSRHDDIVLDFFSGSGTAAHAIMQQNAEDGGNRKYILVQIPEYTNEESEAYKAGYKTISDICIERVKRAGDKIKSEHPDAVIDTGFRVYRLSDSHFAENLFTSDPEKTAEENKAALQAHLEASAAQGLFPADNIADIVTELSLKNGYGLFFTLEPLKSVFPKNTVYCLCGNDKSTLLCLDSIIRQETLDTLIEGHADDRLIIAKIGLDTAATWTLQQAFKDNMQII